MSQVKMAAKLHEEDVNAAPRKTIFVRNLPFETNNKQLEGAFSEFGPIKNAFVVKDKDNAFMCRGFGYVQFVLQDDADNAVKSTPTIDDRKLKISYANKKPKHEKRKRQQQNLSNVDGVENTNFDIDVVDVKTDVKEESDNKSDVDSADVKTDVKEESHDNVDGTQNKKVAAKFVSKTHDKTDLQRTIVLTGLTEKVKRKAFRIMCEKFGEIENIVYPVPERSEVTAFVRFKEYKAAIRATQKIVGQKVKKSHALSAVLLTKEGKNPSKKMLGQSRLIVRNLDFKCDENALRESFSKYGKIIDVNIPTKVVRNRKIKIGCGFVQFDNQLHAKAAVNALNMTEIMGRTVVVDWAVSKEKFEANKTEGTNKSSEMKMVNTLEEEKEFDEDKIDKKKSTASIVKEEIDEEVSADGDDIASDINDSDSDIDNEDDIDNASNDGDVGVDENGDYRDDEDDDEIAPKVKKMKDVKEGKTIFLRNLSYETEDDELIEYFQKYGAVEDCKIVYDHETGRSKGSAFLKFKEKTCADKCLEETELGEDGGTQIRIDGRPVIVSLAVSQGKLGEMKRIQLENKKEMDKRNLYLAYEGVITKNSPGFEGLSEADLKKREKALAEKKTKLKNPNYFVSRTRLCARNLPLSTDANELRNAFVKQLSDPIKITDIKIMRSKDRRDQNGVPRSLGYGFLNIDTHENALKVLRATNNNPNIFDDKRRPIVDFSVENSKALKILEQRKMKNEQKIAQSEDHHSDEIPIKTLREKSHARWEKRVGRYKRKRENKKIENKLESKKQSTFQQHKSVNSEDITPDMNKKKSKRNFEQSTINSNEELSLPKKRSRNIVQKSNDKEEKKFTNLVEQYKKKLTGTKISKKTKSDNRWYE